MAKRSLLTRRQFTASLLASPLIARTALSWSSEPPLTRIALGSCANQKVAQPIWDAVAHTQPDLFLFIGDTVYADTIDAAKLRDCYQQLGDIESFQRFRRRCSIAAVWDDHDYGVNDGGAEHPTKADSQQVFLDFFGTTHQPQLREQAGIYQSFVKGPPGQRVQVILLDTRYHRSPLQYWTVAGRRLYLPALDPQLTMLGDAQWTWLQQQLEVPAEVRIIASSIQVLNRDNPGEKWGNLPHERQRLLDLIEQATGETLLLSGDQHLAEVAAVTLPGGKALFELTSSGMTHTRGQIPAPNGIRVGEKLVEKNFGIVELDWNAPGGLATFLTACDESGREHIRQRIGSQTT